MKDSYNNIFTIFIFTLLFSFFSCEMTNETTIEEKEKISLVKKKIMESKMLQHLKAVSNRDLETLKSTMHPDGKMQLILPGAEIFDGVDAFMNYHTEWFSDTTSQWTFETKILNSEVGEDIGMAITEIKYSEPERNGKPYWNRMIVSYVLENVDGTWYVIKDHASSIKKSTD